MKQKNYVIGYCGLFFFLLSTMTYAQLPYDNTAVSEEEFSLFEGSGIVNFKPHGAELTTGANQTNGVFLEEVIFASERGFILGFDYLMTGVGGNSTDRGANGIALVLFDASVKDLKIGSKTAGLGYSYSNAVNTNEAVPGFTKGFLSIGLDLYGDSKNRKKLDSEYRNGIDIPSKQNNHVTVRGQGDKLEGYPVYISQSVTNIGERYKLDIHTGEYTQDFEIPDPNGFRFKLRENNISNESDLHASFGHPSYRRVIVSLLPAKKLRDTGFYLNVDMIYGNKTSRIINSFFIPSDDMIKYQEASSTTANVLKEKWINTPALFKVGFTATTGTIYQKQIIRNIKINLPFAPIVKDVETPNACIDHTTTIDVLMNSIGFDTNKYVGGQDIASLGSNEHLDPFSFQFLTLVDSELRNTLEPYVATTDAGRYEYSPITKQVVFIPKKGMTSTEDTIYFSIKNKRKVIGGTDLGGEQYRSEGAKIKLNFTHTCNSIIMVNGSAL